MERIIALDIGDKRIGVAVSDPFLTYALPSSTYFRCGNFSKDVDEIVKIIKEKCATTVVCGLPVNFDGSESVQTGKTQRFIQAVSERCKVNVVTEDERFTTMQAHEALIHEGMRREKRKNYVDALAAANILETYLARRNKNNNN